MRRRRGPALAVGISLLFLLGAATTAATGPEDLTVTVHDDNGTMRVHITGTTNQTVNIVLHHDDADTGPVVDRIATVNLTADNTTEVRLRDIRPGIEFNLSILDEDVAIPNISETIGLPNASALPDIPARKTVPVPPLAPYSNGAVHVFEGYPVTDIYSWVTPMRVFVSDEGLVVAAWTGIIQADDPRDNVAEVRAAVSYDGGHTFTDYAVLGHDVTTSNTLPATQLDADGRLHAFFNGQERTEDGRVMDPFTTHVVWDAWSNQTLLDEHVPEEVALSSVGATKDGAGVVVAGVVRLSTADMQPDIVLYRTQADHTLERVGTVTDTNMRGWSFPVYVGVGTAGHFAVAWGEYAGDTYDSAEILRVTRSLDGGLSFGEPAQIAPPYPNASVGMRSPIAVDAAGTVHVAAIARTQPDPDDPDSIDRRGYYARIPLGGTPAYTEVSGPSPDRLIDTSRYVNDLFLTHRDHRIWIFATDFLPFYGGGGQLSGHLVESTDLGLTFHDSFRSERVNGWPLSSFNPLATFPDGRPILIGPYSLGDGNHSISVMPYFDPVPGNDSKLVETEIVSVQADARDQIVNEIDSNESAEDSNSRTTESQHDDAAASSDDTATNASDATPSPTTTAPGIPAATAIFALALLALAFSAGRRPP